LATAYADASDAQLAITTGEKALDAASAQNLPAVAQETETWLKELRAKQKAQQTPAESSSNSP
jgi:hypothetical protein